MPNDKEKANLLFDYYGVLLTEHQRDILIDYLQEDLSLNEIAENYSISKSAVSDLIRRSLDTLKDYDSKLKLLSKDQKLNILLSELEDNNLMIYAAKLKEIIGG